LIIISKEVENAMNGVSNKFTLPGSSEAASLGYGYPHANEELASNGPVARIRAVIKADYVGRTRVLEIRLVEMNNFGLVNQMDADFEATQQKLILKHGPDNSPKIQHVHPPGALAVAQHQHAAHGLSFSL
jgi:hypothetical protein